MAKVTVTWTLEEADAVKATVSEAVDLLRNIRDKRELRAAFLQEYGGKELQLVEKRATLLGNALLQLQ